MDVQVEQVIREFSLVLAHPRDVGILRRLERMIKVEFSQVKIPTGEAICEQRLLEQVESIKEAEVNEQVAALLPKINGTIRRRNDPRGIISKSG